MTPARLIATFGGCGLSPRAPGTVGSFAALLVGLPLLKRPRTLACAAVAATVVGWWATARAGKGEDHSWIVIDEVAGMWIALLACLPDSNQSEEATKATHRLLWPIVAFGLFRVFDITKPGPIGTLDRRHDAIGVMGDDVLAGVASAGCVHALRKVWAARNQKGLSMREQTEEYGLAVLAEAERVLALLRAAELRVVTAESCTGGLVAGALTHFAGSSDVTEGGFVTYSNGMKQAVLGVQASTLAAHGAVSAQTVEQMAEGALNACSSAGVAVSISGIAGPGGGSVDKPVGLVWFATALRGGPTRADQQIFSGDRVQVREQAVLHALRLVSARLVHL